MLRRMSLSAAQVREIVRRGSSETRLAMSREFGVSTRTINRLVRTYGNDPAKLQKLQDSETSLIEEESEHRMRKPQVNLDYKARKVIIKRLNNGETITELAKEYGVSYRTVQRLWRYQDEYIAKINAVKESTGCLATKRISDESPVDKAILEWYKKELVESGVTDLPSTTVRRRALKMNRELKGPKSFKASRYWLLSFKKRYGLSSEPEDPLSTADTPDIKPKIKPEPIPKPKPSCSNPIASTVEQQQQQEGEQVDEQDVKSYEAAILAECTMQDEPEPVNDNFVAISEQTCFEVMDESVGPEEAYKAAATLARFVEASMKGEVQGLEEVRRLRDKIFEMI